MEPTRCLAKEVFRIGIRFLCASHKSLEQIPQAAVALCFFSREQKSQYFTITFSVTLIQPHLYEWILLLAWISLGYP